MITGMPRALKCETRLFSVHNCLFGMIAARLRIDNDESHAPMSIMRFVSSTNKI